MRTSDVDVAVFCGAEAKAKDKGVKLILPTDVVLADKFAADANTKVAKVEDIEDGWMGLDNGPESTKMIIEELSECKTIIWNGARVGPPSDS